MATINSPTFWIPVAISLFSMATAFYEMRQRQRSDEKTQELMLEILDKLTKRINKISSKPRRKTGQSSQELEIKKRRVDLAEKKFNWQKTKEIGNLIKSILDSPDDDYE